jgi:hypothetical protein
MQLVHRPPRIPMKAALRPIRREEVGDGRARAPECGAEARALRREERRVGGLGGEGRGRGIGGAVTGARSVSLK